MSADLNKDMASPEVEDELGVEIPEEIEPSDELRRSYLLSVVADYDLGMIEDVPHYTDVEEDSVLSLVIGEILESQRDNLQLFAPEEDGFKEGDMRLYIHNAIEEALRESEGLAQQMGDDIPESPQDVFNYMLDKAANLRSPTTGIAPYQQFLEQHEHEDLWTLLVQSADAEIWTKVILAGKTQDFDVLDSLPSVPLPKEGGWYIAILKKRDGSRWYRGYGGQAVGKGGVQQRVNGEHQINVLNPNKTSLFMRTWRGDVDFSDGSVQSLDDLSCDCKFVCVGTDQSGLGGKDKSLFANIGEMFFALIFRFLQTRSLQSWLPPGFSLPTEPIGVNVALPLWQNDADASKRSFSLLLRHEDPVVREWARSRILPGLAKARTLRWVGDVDNTNIALAGQEKSLAKAAKEGKASWWRQPDPSLGDALTVNVKCNICGAETVDTRPTYIIADGRYVVRDIACTGSCKPTDAKMKLQRIKSKRTKHTPVASSPYAGSKRSINDSSARRQITKNGHVTPI